MYAINLETRQIDWRFATSTLQQSKLPEAYQEFKMEVKRSTTMDDVISEDKYKSKESTVSLGGYQIESEYTTKSEYSTKSKYQLIDIFEVREDSIIEFVPLTQNIEFEGRI